MYNVVDMPVLRLNLKNVVDLLLLILLKKSNNVVDLLLLILNVVYLRSFRLKHFKECGRLAVAYTLTYLKNVVDLLLFSP